MSKKKSKQTELQEEEKFLSTLINRDEIQKHAFPDYYDIEMLKKDIALLGNALMKGKYTQQEIVYELSLIYRNISKMS